MVGARKFNNWWGGGRGGTLVPFWVRSAVCRKRESIVERQSIVPLSYLISEAPAPSSFRSLAAPDLQVTETNFRDAHSRVRPLPRQETDRPSHLRRRRLRRPDALEAGAGRHHPRAVGAQHDGTVGARGVGEVLFSRGGESFGEVWGVERYAFLS